MKLRLTNVVVGTLVLTLLLLSLDAHAARFFRYKDAQGDLVLSHTIPNSRVKHGYDIVDEHGILLQRVEPQLSEQAYQAKLLQEKKQKECSITLDRVRKLYQTQSDIDYAQSQAMESIDNRIANTKANLTVISKQRQDLEAQAATLDLAGRKIPNFLLDNIQRATMQEQTLTAEIDQRYGEKLALRDDFQYDSVVFELASCDAGLPPRSGGDSGGDPGADGETGLAENAGVISKLTE